MVQWFGLHASNSWWGGVQVPSVIWEIRSHMLCGQKKEEKKLTVGMFNIQIDTAPSVGPLIRWSHVRYVG